MSGLDRGFRIHEHTADIVIECWAPTLSGAFEMAAIATFDTILDVSSVMPRVCTHVIVRGIDLYELLVEWIGRLIALIDIESQFFSR
ncbi:MAG: archease, partial [Candidatus Thorarchaeota archaeon]